MIAKIFTVTFLTGFLASTLRMATPILITALGEMFTERAGIMNLGIEGIIVMGAFTGFTVAYQTESLWLGFLAGGLAGALFGFLMGVASVRFQANQIVAGLGIWILCQGLSSLLNRSIFGITDAPPVVTAFETIPIFKLADIPIIGVSLFNQNVIVYLAFMVVPLFHFIFKRTSWGLDIDAVGEQPRAADAAGLNVGLIRSIATTFGGLMAGFAGAYLTLALYSLYTDDLSVGLGWMAIAVVVFGRWRPWGILGGSLIFGAANALQFRLQAMNFPIPYHFMLMMPFIVTLLIVIFFIRGASGPSALTKPYSRSEN